VRRARLTAGIAVSALVGAVLAVSQPAGAEPSEPAPRTALVYIDEAVTETPNAVAVANDGTIAASLFDNQAIALVTGPGSVVTVSLGCSPSSVAIAPSADTAWAVCAGNPHVIVIDVATGGVSSAGLDLREAADIVYLPGPDRLVVSDLDGQIVVTSTHPNYEPLHVVRTPGFRPDDLAPLADGTRTYATTDSGQLLSVHFSSGRVTALTGQGDSVNVRSVALSRQGTSLYAASYRVGGTTTSLLARLDPVTGSIQQEIPLEFPSPGLTTMHLAAGHRSLSVATGRTIEIAGLPTGAFDIALDDRGRMGAITSLAPITLIGSSVSRSDDGQRAALGTTNSRVVASLLPADRPVSASITVDGRMAKSGIQLSGATTGLQPGSRLTVHVRDATKKRARFVTQARTATVGPRGTYTWKGRATAKRVQVFVTAKDAASPRITLRAKK
jgi:DNA-binding beta-propeller fold protein YncE